MVKNKLDVKAIIFVLLAIIFLIVAFFLSYRVLNIETIPTSFSVGERPGFDLNLTALTFGQVVPGNGASRDITIDNSFDKPVKIEINSKGEISKYLIVSENDFVLQPGEVKEVSFSIFVPEEINWDTYSGEVKIKSLRVFR